MKRLFAALLFLVVAYGVFRYANRPQPVVVTVVAVERGEVAATVVNTRAGTVRPCRRARLAPALGGIIARWPVREGMRVKKGDLLLALWDEDLAARRALAAARVEAAVAQAEAACQQAATAARIRDRYRGLDQAGSVPAETLDRLDGEVAAKEASCRAAQAAVTVERRQVRALDAELAKTRLYAPFDGIVAELNGELGEYLTPSPPGIQTLPAVDLIDPSCYYVVAPIDEVDAGRVAVGMEARITLDAFRDRTFAGAVRRIADYVREQEKQARTVDVEVAFRDPAVFSLMLAGYSADAEIVLARHEGVLRVPTEAVQGEDQVFVVRNGRAELLRIATGLANWRYTEVVDGLAEGEVVITSLDREGVAEGVAVRIQSPASSVSAP